MNFKKYIVACLLLCAAYAGAKHMYDNDNDDVTIGLEEEVTLPGGSSEEQVTIAKPLIEDEEEGTILTYAHYDDADDDMAVGKYDYSYDITDGDDY